MRFALAVALLIAPLAAACIGNDTVPLRPTPSEPIPSRGAPTGPFTVSSPSFADKQPIPDRHACAPGAERSIPLDFKDAPLNATAYALIMEDPDAPSPPYLHWAFWNLPWNVTQLPENTSPTSYGARIGKAYQGPCPPLGSHRYFFYAYATDKPLELAAGSGVAELRQALKGHTAAQAQMMGTYSKIPPN